MTIVIIPARYASTRFPAKPLAMIAGMTMVERVYRQCEKAEGIDAVYVATEHDAIVQAVEAFGGHAIMTKDSHASGTDRIYEAAQHSGATSHEIVINVQGDEPLIEPSAIAAVAHAMQADPTIMVATPITRLTNDEEFVNPNVVKVVLDSSMNGIYFSRAAIPFKRDADTITRYKHIGVYGYRMEALKQFVELPEGNLERSERLEQLRFLEAGIPIRCVEVEYESIAVDVPGDIAKVEARLRL